ncbi:MAG TPA: SpoIIE family protein phosphatase [Candidatus Cybelea sp.]|jgi:PAS domain S-box-containing protein
MTERKRGGSGQRATTGTTSDALLEAERLRDDFRTIAEAMPQLVWTADGEGKIDYVNQRWIDYTGVDLDEFRRRGEYVGIVHADDVDETWKRWTEAIESGTPYEGEFRLRRGTDGGYRWFLCRAVPLFAQDGAVSRWIGTATDVDEQKRARDSLSFMVQAGNVLAASSEAGEICKALARVAIERFADWCFVTLSEGDAFDTIAVEHRDRDRVAFVQQYRDRYPPRPGDALVVAIEENRSALFERITDDRLAAGARDEDHLRVLRSLEMRSGMIVPLATPEGEVLGALTMISAESGRLFDRSDLEIAGAIAARAATAIANTRMLKAERRIAEQLRFTSRVNKLLFETSVPWKAMARVAKMIALEIADAGAILRVQDDALRTEVIVHRKPKINTILRALRGKRTLRLAPERDLVERLRRRETIVFRDEQPGYMRERVWPYLSGEIDALSVRSSVIVPLYAGKRTYGALVAHYSDRPFDPDDVALLEEIAARASVAVEQVETLERERKIATTLQQASLPTLIPQIENLRFDAVYSPAGDEGDVGGDWYDAIELDDGSVVVSVGDVTGRGIQAAAIMSKVRHAMGMAPLHESDPTKILDSAGWFLGKRYPDAIVTAFVAIVSPDRRTIRFANAGHPLPLLWRDGASIELKASGLPLGLRSYAPAEKSASMELRDGDVIVLFTDGLIEATRNLSEGERLLREVVNSGVLSASVAPAKLVARACLPARVHDDVAILSVSVGRAPAWTFAAEDARAAVDARAQFVQFLHQAGHDDELVDRTELIFGELLGNVVRHAPGPVEVSFDVVGESATLHVIDSGSAFSLAQAHLPEDAFAELGRGLFIVAQLAAGVRVKHVPNCGNHISVVL